MASALSWVPPIAIFCAFFYILGSFQSPSRQPATVVETERLAIASVVNCSQRLLRRNGPERGDASLVLDFAAHHRNNNNASLSLEEGEEEGEGVPAQYTFEDCGKALSEYTPCEDLKRSLRFPRAKLIYRERHCPMESEKLRCLVPPPPGYTKPFRWPKSRDFAWYANIPHKELTVEKASQNWVRYVGHGRFQFPGGGTMFPKGAASYIKAIGALIPLTDGSIRTALDTGCGVASFGAYLLDKGILTMSFAPRDTHEAQVQFALERGVPAMLGIMASYRLPYPARAFDIAHCSRCLIPWNKYDGLYLLEIDRVLRPGGYWILSGPPINWNTRWRSWNRTKESLKDEQDTIEDLARRICWKKIIEKGNLAIWQKSWNRTDCIDKRRLFKTPPMCQRKNLDYAWYTKLEACITHLPNTDGWRSVSGGMLAKWPQRLTAVPPRIANNIVPGITPNSFMEDTELWQTRISHYKRAVIPSLGQGLYRNVMDMHSGLGGFAAALGKDELWVMNVVPSASKENTLGAIYERGLIGTYHNWCEAFSTYPRTYDLLHANTLFSMYQDRCDIVDILIEMDRILRPQGAVIIRDEVDILNKVSRIAVGMRWGTRMVDHESGPLHTQKILIAVKK